MGEVEGLDRNMGVNPKPPDKQLTRYLTTWMIMHGQEYITEAQSIAIDETIGDDDEMCWSYCLDQGYIYNPNLNSRGYIGDKTKLTKAGIQFINRSLYKEKQDGDA